MSSLGAQYDQISAILRATTPIFRSFTDDDRKKDLNRKDSPVTPADKKIADYLRAELRSITPNHTIITEDADTTPGDPDKPTWVVDPIDGTIPFMANIPTFTTSIYQVDGNKVLLAYGYNPTTDELYHYDGQYTYCNERRTQVGQKKNLKESTILIPAYAFEVLPGIFTALRNAGAYVIVQEGLVFRSMLVANGYADATIQPILKMYESGTVIGLVEGAGGTVTHTTKASITVLESTKHVIAANASLTKELCVLLHQVMSKMS